MPGLRGSGCGVLDDAIYGDGSDGDVTVTSSLFINRDMFYRNLRVIKGVTFFTYGHKIRVREVLTIDGDAADVGVIANNGVNARNSTGQASEISGSSIPPGTSGAPRGTTGGGGRGGAGMYHGGRGIGNTLHPSQTGSALVPAVDIPSAQLFMFGGAGGRGGDAFSGTYGANNFYVYAGDTGSAELLPPSVSKASMGGINNFFSLLAGGSIGFGSIPSESGSYGSGSFNVIAGGAGGGAGACMNSGTIGIRPRSGWGGGGGGVVFMTAREIVINGRIDARGGNGGNTFGRAGGGAGGGGGFIYLAYSKLTLRNAIDQHLITAGGLPGIGQTLPMSGSVVVSATGSQPGITGSYLVYEV